MRLDNFYDGKGEGSIKRLIKEKMIVLADFDICAKDDEKMIHNLREIISRRPNSDPRRVLDCYCKPIIQEKLRSWN